MSKVVKVIEVLAESENGWEDAVKAALTEASKTVRHIRSLYFENLVAAVENGKIKTYRMIAKISLDLEPNRQEQVSNAGTLSLPTAENSPPLCPFPTSS